MISKSSQLDLGRLAFLLAAGASASGCITSSAGSAADAGFGTDSGFGADVAAPTDAAAGADGGSAGDGSAASGYLGTIALSQASLGATFSTSASASFERVQLKAGAPGCTSTTFGVCATSVCPETDAGAPAYVVDDVGIITIAGATGIAPLTLTFDAAMKRYSPAMAMSRFFAAGDSISVSATGGSLPAFAAQKVIAPGDIAYPDCPGTMCTDIDRTIDKVVTWTGGGAGKVQFTVETTSNTQSTALFCLWDAATGTGTVPAAALGMLDKADNMASGIAGVEIVFSFNETSFAVGSYPKVTFNVQGTGVEGFVNMSR